MLSFVAPVPGSEARATLRVAFFDLHIWITKVYLDDVTLVVLNVNGKLFGSARRTERLVEFDLAPPVLSSNNPNFHLVPLSTKPSLRFPFLPAYQFYEAQQNRRSYDLI